MLVSTTYVDLRLIMAFLRNFIGLLLCIFCYRDSSRLTAEYTAKDVLRQVDYIGGFLSATGVTLFMMGLQWGASQVRILLSFAWNLS